MHRGRFVALFVCVLLVTTGSATAAPSDGAFAQQDIEPDDVLLSITVEDDGDARWTVEYRTRLETDEDQQAFEELRSDIEADPEPYADRFRDRMNGTAATAENATGREMAITEMSVSAERSDLPQEYGVLRYRFRWSNFAAVDGDRLLVGDAIGGLFLDDETSLLVSWSSNHTLRDASPEPTETRDRTVVYDGPIEFTSDEPRIELGTAGATPTGADPSPTVSTPVVAGIVVVLLAAVGGALVAYRRRGDSPSADGGSGDADGEVTDDARPEPDDELLSNEEQVLRLIEREGGRMKQQAVAEELGWTDAKTSQVTKKLREEGELEGFRLGRENVLSLPDESED